MQTPLATRVERDMPPKNVRLILDNPSGDSFCAASALAERLAFGCKRSRTVWRARGSCGFEDRRSA
ncbi:TPA: hypothetical protein N0H66_005531 [Pseudomonas aeruginosa]|nr:hypothetical protein [Pseudomonas aeruginosa]